MRVPAPSPFPVSALLVLAAVLALGGCSGSRSGSADLADGSAVRKADPRQMGAELYRSYCLNCHGEDGRGDGTIAALLNVVTPDLTTIAAENGGEFPTDLIYRQIDGTDYIAPHGTGLMPVWGVVLNPDFQIGGDHDGREVAARQIDALVAYLKTLQQ